MNPLICVLVFAPNFMWYEPPPAYIQDRATCEQVYKDPDPIRKPGLVWYDTLHHVYYIPGTEPKKYRPK